MNYPTDQYEIIVVNDGSTDKTGIILETLQAKYGQRLRTVRLLIIGARQPALIVL